MFSPFGFMGTQAGGGLDPDATAYINAVITAGGSFSGVEETAIDTFYVNLKSDGIYSKLIQMYTFMGGTSSSNAINLINPGTADLTFNGTWTHNTTGSFAAQNNANYADTGWNTLTNAAITTASLAWGYQNNNNQTSATIYGYMGSGTGTSDYAILGVDGITALDNFNPTNTKITISGVGGSGGKNFNAMARLNTSSVYYLGYSPTATNSVTVSTSYGVSPYNGNLHINRINGANFPAGGRYTFSFIGNGLSSIDLDNLYTKLDTMNASFSNRQL